MAELALVGNNPAKSIAFCPVQFPQSYSYHHKTTLAGGLMMIWRWGELNPRLE